MRRFLAGALVAAILVVLGIGLLPPVLVRGQLGNAAMTAAKAGAGALAAGGGASAADAAALRSIAARRSLQIVSMGPVPGKPTAFAVTVQEHVHTFMDQLNALGNWFVVTATQQSSLSH